MGDSWGTRLNPQPGFSTISKYSEAVFLFPMAEICKFGRFLQAPRS